MPTRKAKPARKRTSDRVSRIAASILRRLGDMPGQYLLRNPSEGAIVRAWELRALAASCLSQDEVKGKRK